MRYFWAYLVIALGLLAILNGDFLLGIVLFLCAIFVISQM
jgi:hypothetical protein